MYSGIPPATINGSQCATMLHLTGNWLMLFHMKAQQRHICSLHGQFRIIHRYFPCRYNLHLWNIVGDNKCEFCNDADTLSQYFAECDSVVQFWKFLKRWFIRTFQFVINFTSLDILLGIPIYDNSNDVMILNFVILFVKYYMYNCKKNGVPIDFFSFLVKLKSHLIIEEYRHIMYNRSLESATK